MDLIQTIAASYPLVVGVGAFLLVFGLGFRHLSYAQESKDLGSTIMRYGWYAIFLALVLYGIGWYIEAWLQ